MASEYAGTRILDHKWPAANWLRKDFPYMAGSLEGSFARDDLGGAKFNVYENGRVASRELVSSADSRKKNPTVGVILDGQYHFPTGNNTETLTVLEGVLEASVDDGPVSILKRDGTIVAPPGTILNLRVKKDDSLCFYICRYTPKGEGK